MRTFDSDDECQGSDEFDEFLEALWKRGIDPMKFTAKELREMLNSENNYQYCEDDDESDEDVNYYEQDMDCSKQEFDETPSD